MELSLNAAAEALNAGQVIAIPTETVYGLAASIRYPQAISCIFQLKKRPADNPLIVHAANIAQVQELTAHFPQEARLLAEKFWPGPLTLILPANLNALPPIALANLPTVAIRIPAHPQALALIEKTGPLVAPSANLSGRPSATCQEHIALDFGANFPLLAGGPALLGLESTILSYQNGVWYQARLGAIPIAQIEAVLQKKVSKKSLSQSPICPGQRYRHYAPQAALILGEGAYPGNPPAVIGFTERDYPQAKQILSLGSLNNPGQVASQLYATLRKLDALAIQAAWVDCNFPHTGLFITLIERLKKAANHSGEEISLSPEVSHFFPS